jgi:hypothetical protein
MRKMRMNEMVLAIALVALLAAAVICCKSSDED